MDYYQALGIAKGADEKTIRKAYRRQALKYHPDKNPDPSAVDQFRLISEALNALLLQGGSAAGTHKSEQQQQQQHTTRKESHAQWAEELRKAEKFREKLFKSTKPESSAQGVHPSHKRLRELSMINTKLRRRRMGHQTVNCRTLRDGKVFDTVREARAYVDTHPEAQLMDSWFENEYSKRYEYETLRRVNSFTI